VRHQKTHRTTARQCPFCAGGFESRRLSCRVCFDWQRCRLFVAIAESLAEFVHPTIRIVQANALFDSGDCLRRGTNRGIEPALCLFVCMNVA
jgi:hypothetical protein